jgi:magnesium-transporting ATPase (P-type)
MASSQNVLVDKRRYRRSAAEVGVDWARRHPTGGRVAAVLVNLGLVAYGATRIAALATATTALIAVLGTVLGAGFFAWVARPVVRGSTFRPSKGLLWTSTLVGVAVAAIAFPGRTSHKYWAPTPLQLIADGLLVGSFAALTLLVWQLRHRPLGKPEGT